MTRAEFDVGFSISPSMKDGLLGPTIATLTDAGLVIRTEHRESDTYASTALWMTGVVVYLGRPVWKGFRKALDKDLEKLGENLYGIFREALLSFWRVAAAPDRSYKVAVIATQGKMSLQPYMLEVSFRAKSLNDVPLLLVFPPQISEDNFVMAVEQFCEQARLVQPVANHGIPRAFIFDSESSRLTAWHGDQAS